MVPFVWVGRIIAMSSRRLVPGDVVVLQRGKATCDMVLLRGAGLVEESMMSGEVSTVSDRIWLCHCSFSSTKLHAGLVEESMISGKATAPLLSNQLCYYCRSVH